MSVLQHSPFYTGGPCRRCGLRYSSQTAYVPCFEPGDTLETWRARQHPDIQAMIPNTADDAHGGDNAAK